jgi:hypothetical protein
MAGVCGLSMLVILKQVGVRNNMDFLPLADVKVFLFQYYGEAWIFYRKEHQNAICCMNEVSVICTGCDMIKLQKKYRHQKIKGLIIYP